MPSILTIAAQIQCPHGGLAVLTTSNTKLTVSGIPALLETDIPIVAGCPFTVGVVYSPCVKIDWVTAATTLTVGGAAVVLESSVGLCANAAGAPQGPAVVSGGAPQVSAI